MSVCYPFLRESLVKKHQAILMAAGVGSRISAHTRKPKSTLTVGDSHDTIIGHTIRMLEDHDFAVNIVVGYKKENVKSLLREFDIRYFENPFFRVTNSIGSLWFAREALVEAQANGQDVVLANADVYWSKELLEKLLADDHDLVLLGDKSRTDEGDYFFKADEDGTLIDYGKGMDPEERTCEYVGAGKVGNAALGNFIRQIDALIWREKYTMWWEDALYRFSNRTPVNILDVDGAFWGEVDTLEDYQRIIDHVLAEQQEQQG